MERSKGSLPKSWIDLRNLHSDEEPQYFSDPFQGYRSRFKTRFQETRTIFWSVGPDGIDSSDIGGERTVADDDLVVTMIRSGDELEVQFDGFSLWREIVR